ncbi:MAG: hydroxyacid dehydrogenase [Patescibacteria group bacterium]
MKEILVADGLSKKGIKVLTDGGNRVENNSKIDPQELLNEIPKYSALIVRGRTKVTAEVIRQGTSLIVVGRAGVGVDNIDLDAARKANIIVVNSPTATSIAVAELTIGLMLAQARMIPTADTSLKNGLWEKTSFTGSELCGKTLSLLGLGNIGREVASRAVAFGMKIVAYDPALDESEIKRRGATPVTLSQALQKADYLSLHLPLNEKTRGLIGTEQLSQMKKGSRIICLARGGIVDEVALKKALDENHLAGAALDVFSNEPVEKNSIATHPKVTATPHIGAQTKEAQERASIAIAEEIVAALEDKSLRWQVKY